MDLRIDSSSKVIRNIVLLVTIFILLHFANITDVFSYLSRPMIILAAKIFGITAVDRGSYLLLGKLVLPWTRDCSGINTLVMLWGITLWANRSQLFGFFFIGRLLLCIPAALIVNVFRIYTLAAYRFVYFPEWETPQLHYFIGFLWLLPLLFLFVKDLRKKNWPQWLEVLYMAVVLALLAPVVFSPGGSVVTVCALFYIAHNHISGSSLKGMRRLNLLWGTLAMVIAWSRMESLWIPWLLVCPRFVDRRLLYSFSGLIILSGTISLLAMRTEWQIVVLLALAFQAYGLLRKRDKPVPAPIFSPPRLPEIVMLAFLTLVPFILPGVIGISHELERPPMGIMSKQLSFNSYKLRVGGQSSDISMYWYGSFGDGRHHALPACMRFRGIILEKDKQENSVYFGDNKWMREFFIHEKILKTTYHEYLLASFSPFASPGVHIIFEAPMDLMSSTYFSRASEQIVNQLHHMYSNPNLS